MSEDGSNVTALPGQTLGNANFSTLVEEFMSKEDLVESAIVIFIPKDRDLSYVVRMTGETTQEQTAMACVYLSDVALGGEKAS